ncbi:hypothetical protein AB0D54_34155 [Streptomyces xanthophaeus]|uniref:hypothetical protein n=1 Tax=Streptomyces xanthophaeus TaxID=67385 RepID=UPI00341EFDF0
MEWTKAGGEVKRAPDVTIGYDVRIIAAIDDTTNIGERDAFLAALACRSPIRVTCTALRGPASIRVRQVTPRINSVTRKAPCP